MKRLFATLLLAGLAPQWAAAADTPAPAPEPAQIRRVEPWSLNQAPPAAQPVAVAPEACGTPCAGGACGGGSCGYGGKGAWACVKDWFCFRQTPNCLGFTPTPYCPPLYVWFPCDPSVCGGPQPGCQNGHCHGGFAPAAPVYYGQPGAPVAGPTVAPTPMPAREPAPAPMPAPNTGVRANPPASGSQMSGFRMAAPENPSLAGRPPGYRPPPWATAAQR